MFWKSSCLFKVLHHLASDGNGEDFPEIEQALEEAKRVLRPKGIVIIMEVTPTMIRESYWYTQLGRRLNIELLHRTQ